MAIQSYKERLDSFENEKPRIVIDRLLESLHNFFILRELKKASDHGLWYLLMMGVHACILTVNEQILGYKRKNRKEGFKSYLENFVDGEDDALRFSRFSNDIYDRRNVLAHQWFDEIGHRFGFDDSIDEGIRKENEAIILNPVKYYENFESSFNPSHYKSRYSIRTYVEELGDDKLEASKERIIYKFKRQ